MEEHVWTFREDGGWGLMGTEKPRVWAVVTTQDKSVIKRLVEEGIYLTQGEVVRAALRLLYEKHGIILSPEEVVGW